MTGLVVLATLAVPSMTGVVIVATLAVPWDVTVALLATCWLIGDDDMFPIRLTFRFLRRSSEVEKVDIVDLDLTHTRG